jgi:hypothetical protein
MDKIRINMTLESVSDSELYEYLKNVLPRRRATLLRALAVQGLNGCNQLKAGIVTTVSENKPDIPKPRIKDDEVIITDKKQKQFSSAFDDML